MRELLHLDREIAIVVAYQRGRGMGYKNRLPWNLREDRRHFTALTSGHTVIMGRKTHESIGRVLEDRRNIVISRTPVRARPVETYPSLREALGRVGEEERVFVIGGEALFAEALDVASLLYITEVEAYRPVDRFFPEFDAGDWVLESTTSFSEDQFNEFPHIIKNLQKKRTQTMKICSGLYRTAGLRDG
ncbi:MAG: dihydrofolate reductase, partial [Simkaniaceae bacterium]|nr:dihydrofolate reductase [Simkaniaceae bacterium]